MKSSIEKQSLAQQRCRPKAVIYCRISSTAQLRKGDGLRSQETRCRDFAKHKLYQVVEVFKDEGASGGMIDRPGMQAMLKYLKSCKQEEHFVIIDDISRLARGLEAHLQLRTSIDVAGGILVSPSIEFGEDSDSILVENLLASVSQHQRQKNAEQTKNRMHARVMNGYWGFSPVIGYRYDVVSGHSGKILVRDEPVAAVVQQALEGYASGRFETQSEVKRFLDFSIHFPKGKNGKVHPQQVQNLLNQALYAGYINVKKWEIRLHPAKHEPLISFGTFQAIQKRLNGQAKAPARKDLHEDFPLRGFVCCSSCTKPMTACWSTGRNGKYPYYLCSTKGCVDYRKSIRKELMEEQFEALLMQLQPSQNLFYMVNEMFKDLWEERQQFTRKEAGSMKGEISTIERKIDQFLDRIVATENSTAITRYENEITKLEEQKITINEKIRNCGRPLKPFDETFRTAMTFLASPCFLWSSDRLEEKTMVLRLAFDEQLSYQRNEGFRTARTSLPFRVLEDFKGGHSNMVRPTGVEPVTS